MKTAQKFVRQVALAHPRVRIFCFPFAGGSGAVFAGWGERLQPEIEVWAAQPRGRAMRYSEPPLASVEAMVDEYLAALRPSLGQPFAFYGHSLGGLLAFELTRRLCADGLPMPMHLFIGASAPPHMGLIHEEIGHLDDPEFVLALQDRYGGIPEQVLNEPELLQIFLPPLKADFAAYEQYRYRKSMSVGCPMTVFAGEQDPGLAWHLMEEWSRHAQAGFTLHPVPGDHFFLSTSADAVLWQIRKSLEEGSDGVQGTVTVSAQEA